MSFSFGTPNPDGNTPGGFSFGANAGAGDAKANTAGKPIPFGTTQSSSTLNLGGFSATGNAATTTTSSAPAFNAGGSLLGATTTASAAGGFSFGGATSTVAASASGTAALPSSSLGGAASASSTSGFGLLGALKTTTAVAPTSAPTSTGISLGGTTSSSVAATNVATSTSFGFGIGTAKTTAVASVAPTPSFSLSTTAPKTMAGGTTGFSLTSIAPTLSSTVVTSSASTVNTGNLNFGQLVDAITKWTIDLEEQGKLFSNQAKQLNAWDRLLVSNGEKVMSLNSGIERVKQQQQQLDQELDFVHAQQKELEDLITPLEKDLADIPLTDVDRLHTYQLAENMDTQLKQMSEDLKEIIEQLNESNKAQENSNPITQIRKILNAHMDSLQWIDRHTSKITGHLDQISKMHDLHRKSHEHSLKKTYD